ATKASKTRWTGACTTTLAVTSPAPGAAGSCSGAGTPLRLAGRVGVALLTGGLILHVLDPAQRGPVEPARRGRPVVGLVRLVGPVVDVGGLVNVVGLVNVLGVVNVVGVVNVIGRVVRVGGLGCLRGPRGVGAGLGVLVGLLDGGTGPVRPGAVGDGRGRRRGRL